MQPEGKENKGRKEKKSDPVIMARKIKKKPEKNKSKSNKKTKGKKRNLNKTLESVCPYA